MDGEVQLQRSLPAAGEIAHALPDPQRLRALIRRYAGPGPRYTSYPTAPEWSEDFGPAAYAEALAGCEARAVSLYVHVPYCERLCAFCACNRTITQDHALAGPYLDRIARELDRVVGALPTAPPQLQLAIGGGSPNFLHCEELERLVRRVDAHFAPLPGAERSIELDPRRTSDEQLERLIALGMNRVSFGVQDLDPRVQEAIRRRSRPERLTSLVQQARALGVLSINFDLIYGLPEQSVDSFRETLRRVIELRPDRIALYGYAHVTWISKAQRGFEKRDLPSPERRLAIFAAAIETLVAAGYRFLGMDHFALPDDALAQAADRGRLTRNFMGYTIAAGEALLGFGPSGISELPRAYAQSEKDPEAWAAAVDANRLPTVRGCSLDRDDLERRWLIRSLLCQGRIAEQAFAETFGVALHEKLPGLEADLNRFMDDDLLAPEEGGYRVTEIGRLFLRPMAMVFDAYLGRAPRGGKRYSATV